MLFRSVSQSRYRRRIDGNDDRLSFIENNYALKSEIVLVGSGIPTSVAEYKGQLYVDYSSGLIYSATGDNAASDWVSKAYQLANTVTVWGRPFNGTQSITGELTGVTAITASGNITATTFIGALSGTASNASLLENHAASYFETAQNSLDKYNALVNRVAVFEDMFELDTTTTPHSVHLKNGYGLYSNAFISAMGVDSTGGGGGGGGRD